MFILDVNWIAIPPWLWFALVVISGIVSVVAVVSVILGAIKKRPVKYFVSWGAAILICAAFLCCALVFHCIIPSNAIVGNGDTVTYRVPEEGQIRIQLCSTGDKFVVEFDDFGKALADNINSLEFQRAEEAVGQVGYSYVLEWLNGQGKVFERLTIVPMDGTRILHDGYYYDIKDGKRIDTDLIAEMLDIFLSSAPAPDPAAGEGSEPRIFEISPVLTVNYIDSGFEALRGTTSWIYDLGDGTSSGIEMDCAHPLDCKEVMPAITLFKGTYMDSDTLSAELVFEAAPDSLTVRCWSDEYWGRADEGDADYELVDVTAMDPGTIPGYTGTLSPVFSFQLKEGNYIYEIIAEWNSREEYSGTSRYSFYTVTGGIAATND